MADNSLTTVDFHGAKLIARRGETPAETLVAMKPVVEGMGLDWGGQHKKLMGHPILSEGVSVITIPSRGGPQEMVALSLNRLNFWLATLQPDRISDPDTRAKVLTYQTECADVLFDHFFYRGTNDTLSPALCRDFRTMLGLGRGRLAELSGLAVKTLENFEAERSVPDGATVLAIRRGFDRALAEQRHLLAQARKPAAKASPPPEPMVRLQFTVPVAVSAKLCAYVARLTDAGKPKTRGTTGKGE